MGGEEATLLMKPPLDTSSRSNPLLLVLRQIISAPATVQIDKIRCKVSILCTIIATR